MEHKKRLSPFRLLILTTVIVAMVSFSAIKLNKIQTETKLETPDPWFAAYVDVTSTPKYNFEQYTQKDGQKHVVLSFIVSSDKDVCMPSWGNAYTLDEAAADLDLDRRIERYRLNGGNIAVSFGGLINSELANECKNEDKLYEAYSSVVSRYNIDTIDIDIEGDDQTNDDSLARRARVLSKLQNDLRTDGKKLAIWITLPVAPNGLTSEGANVVSKFLENGVDLAGVNVMTMNYSNSRQSEDSMAQASVKALDNTHRQLKALYSQSGTKLTDGTIWKKIGATPMIGQNDIPSDIFTLEDARLFNEIAVNKNIGRMSMWSGNRDVQCGENYANTNRVSDSCSGIKQEKFDFTNLLSANFKGTITGNADKITSNEPIPEVIDDPAKSPYEIWSEDNTYLAGTKVVWKRNVYEAKWWNKGEIPDNPVLSTWETPWQLIGPVLPGETPLPQPQLPKGTYPQWSGIVTYEAGSRVMFDGKPFEAKWWTQGDSPAASSSNPDTSPWIGLTRKQIEEVLVKIKDN